MKVELTPGEILTWPFTVDASGHAKVQFLGVSVARSRLVVWAATGRLLQTTHEVVHHVNEDKLDDRPSNLVVLTRSEHMKLHNGKQPWIGRGWERGRKRGAEFAARESAARKGKSPWGYKPNNLPEKELQRRKAEWRRKVSSGVKANWVKRKALKALAKLRIEPEMPN